MQRYIMKNRELFTMSHGERRSEYIIYDDSGEVLDRCEITPSTARWMASNYGMEWQSPAHYYSTVVCR